MKKYIISAISILIVAGCGGGGSYNNNSDKGQKKAYKPTQKSFNVTDHNQISKVTKTGNSNITLNIDSAKDVYVVVTSHFDNQKISISSPSASSDIESRSKVTARSLNKDYIKTPQNVLNFRDKVSTLLSKKYTNTNSKKLKLSRVTSTVNEGDSFNFCTDTDDNDVDKCTEHTKATAKKVVKDITTKYGKKSLVVWLADDENNIDQAMIDKLADTFLKDGKDNDIYDWDTNIFGDEWGSDASGNHSNLISNNDTINIVLYNMHKNGLAGYFFPKDNFTSGYIPSSNEKIMFYINSQMYADNEKETFTTLAHEFQHMIHFYRRTINNIDDDTWFDEMMSETTEDLVATKLEYRGPRSVAYYNGKAGPIECQHFSDGSEYCGRYPGFNSDTSVPLTTWGYGAAPYSKVSAFGAFLLRNYGGAKVLHDMMYSQDSNELAVLDATGESSFETLLNKWAEAVMLSDRDDLDDSKPRYNFGDFKETTYGEITYKLGSINFFNYDPKPKMSSSETLDKDANLYYKVGNGKLSGKVKIDVNIEKGGDVIIIAK